MTLSDQLKMRQVQLDELRRSKYKKIKEFNARNDIFGGTDAGKKNKSLFPDEAISIESANKYLTEIDSMIQVCEGHIQRIEKLILKDQEISNNQLQLH